MHESKGVALAFFAAVALAACETDAPTLLDPAGSGGGGPVACEGGCPGGDGVVDAKDNCPTAPNPKQDDVLTTRSSDPSAAGQSAELA